MEKDQPERPDAQPEAAAPAASVPPDPGPPDPTPPASAGPTAEGEPHTALPPRVEAWRKRSAAGAILTGFALGLQDALQSHRDEPSIVIQTSGDLPDDLAVEADFEYGRPRQSVVSIRPWLLHDADRDPAAPPAGEQRPSDPGSGGADRPASDS